MLTGKVISATPPRVGRRKVNYDQTPARFPEGTLAKVDALCEPGESRADFLREAVDREIKRRQRGR